MSAFTEFVKRYNNKDVLPTLEAMHKMMNFYRNNQMLTESKRYGIEMLKLGCRLQNSANICLHKSTNHKFFPFVESEKDFTIKYART